MVFNMASSQPFDSFPFSYVFKVISILPLLVLAHLYVFFLKKNYLFIYLWLRWVFVAAWAFSSCGEQGLLFVAVCGLLIEVASLVA